jgi:hypothetical protein
MGGADDVDVTSSSFPNSSVIPASRSPEIYTGIFADVDLVAAEAVARHVPKGRFAPPAHNVHTTGSHQADITVTKWEIQGQERGAEG